MYKQLDDFDLNEEQYYYITDSLDQLRMAIDPSERIHIDYEYYEDETQELMYSVNLTSTETHHTRTICYISR